MNETFSEHKRLNAKVTTQPETNQTVEQQHQLNALIDAEQEIGLLPNHLSKGVGEVRTLQELLQRDTIKTFACNYIMHGVNESVVAQLSKSVFSTEQLQTLYQSTKLLEQCYSPHNLGGKRGAERVLHIGYWRKYSSTIQPTKETSNAHVQRWINQNQESGFFCNTRILRETNHADTL